MASSASNASISNSRTPLSGKAVEILANTQCSYHMVQSGAGPPSWALNAVDSLLLSFRLFRRRGHKAQIGPDTDNRVVN